MNCPKCGYSDRFRTCGFNPDGEYARKEDVDPAILTELARQDPFHFEGFVYHASKGKYVYRMTEAVFKVAPHKDRGWSGNSLENTGRKTPMTGLSKMLHRRGVYGSVKKVGLDSFFINVPGEGRKKEVKFNAKKWDKGKVFGDKPK